MDWCIPRNCFLSKRRFFQLFLWIGDLNRKNILLKIPLFIKGKEIVGFMIILPDVGKFRFVQPGVLACKMYV